MAHKSKRKTKIPFVIKDEKGRVIGGTQAVSPGQARTNFWWRHDARSNRELASEVKEKRAGYFAAPVMSNRGPALPKKPYRRRTIPGQGKLFRL